jgi:hypothetical protein
LETEVEGPGTFTIHLRHNYNPYTRLSLLVDGRPTEEWEPTYTGAPAPSEAFSGWRRMSAAVPPGTHTIRILHEFGCNGIGTIFINHPAIQADHAQFMPPASSPLLEAIEASGGEGWLAGGAVEFQVLNDAQAWDGVDALRAPAVPASGFGPEDSPSPPWLQREVAGPVSLRWQERAHGAVEAPWFTRDLFIPPGPHTFRWTAADTGQDLDGVAEATAPALPLGEALESGDRRFTQSGGTWAGVLTAAAPDGVDAAWVRVDPGQSATIETEVEGPVTLRFQFSTTAAIESGAFLSFAINGRPVAVQSESVTALVPSGLHRMSWTASKYWEEPAVVLLDAIQIEPAASVSLGEALDAPELLWTSGPVRWIGLASNAAPDGTDAAVPPPLNPGDSAWIETAVTGPGRLTFHWPLTDQSPYSPIPSPLRIIIDDHHVYEQSALQPRPVVEVGSGRHTFRWLATGQDAWRLAALDKIGWTPWPAAPRLLALDGLTAPVIATDESFAIVRNDVTHDGSDALRLLRAPGVYSGQSSSSLATWVEGPGHLYYWWRATSGAKLAINGAETTAATVDGEWKRGIHFVPPGWRRQSWSILNNNFSANDPEVFLDELSFIPSLPIALDIALPGAAPWRTSTEAPWTGLPADFVLSTTPAAHAPLAPSSWLETDISGPAVVAFTAFGERLIWLVDGVPTGSASSRRSTPLRATVFVPPGRHTLRWHNREATPASLAETSVHPLDGDLSMAVATDTVLIRVPRPAGFTDAQISLQYADSLESGYWLSDFSSQVHHTEPTAVTFSLQMPSDSTRFWRAAYAPR